MSAKKVLSGVVQADVDISNNYDPPKAGAQGSIGVQVVIPVDFAARVALGQDVEGCTYTRVEADGSLYVTPVCIAAMVGPNAITSLAAGLRPSLPAYITKVNAGQVVP
jgi:hypothetical protein